MRVPLALLPENSEGVIIEILGGRGLVRRLLELGFIPGERVKVLHSSPGPILVSIKGSRIALGRGTAMRIIVDG